MPIWLPMPEGRLNRIRRNCKEFNEENFIVLSALREWTLHYSPHFWEWEKMNKKILFKKMCLVGLNLKQKGSFEIFELTSKTTNQSVKFLYLYPQGKTNCLVDIGKEHHLLVIVLVFSIYWYGTMCFCLFFLNKYP